MANNIKPRPFDPVVQDLKRAGFGDITIWAFRDMMTRIDKVLTNAGEVQSVANVTGRTEPIGTTVQNLTSVGALASTDNIAADGIGSPLTGGKRGFIALDTNNRLAGTFHSNGVNVSFVPISATTLSNDGVSTAIAIASHSAQFGDGTISYNSGSVDPGSFGSWYIYTDDPTFAGGAVTYQVSGTIQDQSAANGRMLVGSIKTVNGSAKTGGGNTGGTGGASGGRGFVKQV